MLTKLKEMMKVIQVTIDYVNVIRIDSCLMYYSFQVTFDVLATTLHVKTTSKK